MLPRLPRALVPAFTLPECDGNLEMVMGAWERSWELLPDPILGSLGYGAVTISIVFKHWGQGPVPQTVELDSRCVVVLFLLLSQTVELDSRSF